MKHFYKVHGFCLDTVYTLMGNGNYIFEAAAKYLDRGWAVVPIPFRSKKPVIKAWQELNVTAANIDQYFNSKPQNIGVLQGERSGGLVDIDLDSPEAVKLADRFLPRTNAVFGRKGKPSSHRLYICRGVEYRKLNDPLMMASTDESHRKNACIVEIRAGNGKQTVFPPSVHEGGDPIEWVFNGEPSRIEGADLAKAVGKLAAAALLAKYWREGVRHDLSLAVAGTLLRNKWSAEETKHFVNAVAVAAGDGDVNDRLRSVSDTNAALLKNQRAFGLPKFAELTDKRIAHSFCEWLGIRMGEYSAGTPTPAKEQGFNVVCMRDVVATQIEWLWKPLIPIGEFTILEGIEGIGKSWFGCALATAVAAGSKLPFDEGEAVEPGVVLLLSAEDSLSHTIRPRLDSMGADLERIFALDEVFSLNDQLDLLCFEAEIAKYKPKLVFIDPMFSYTAGKDLNAESSSRPIARKLIALAQEYDCAIVGVRHVGKSKGQGDPRNAGLGSISWRASARSVLLVGEDIDTGERAICQTKNNLAEAATVSVGFDIKDGQFLFRPEGSSLTKERMLAQAKDPDVQAEQHEAIGFLRETLRGVDSPSKEVEKEAKELGITSYALRRAKAILGVESFKKGGTYGGDKKWYMRLPRPAEVVDIRRIQPVQRNDLDKTNSGNGLPQDVEYLGNRQDQQIVPPPSPDSGATEALKLACLCGEMAYVGRDCRNCGESVSRAPVDPQK